MMYIAENLKALRKARDMTQEEAAAILNVSAQSVSKWERGDTYPDITLLPMLANLYETSVDALIGMDKINDTQAKAAVFREGQKHMYAGNNTDAAGVYAEALKTYPNDEGIMLELAITLALQNEPDKLEQAVAICRRILSLKPTDTIKFTTKAALSYIYVKAGDESNARGMAKDLPRTAICYETVLAEIDKGADEREVDAKLRFIAASCHDDPDYDIVLVDFGIDLVCTCKEHGLLEKIGELRAGIKKDKKKRQALPPVRIRDNIDLAPNQLRVRFCSEYLIDKTYDDPAEAVNEILGALSSIGQRCINP